LDSAFNPEFVAGTTSKRAMEKAQSKKFDVPYLSMI